MDIIQGILKLNWTKRWSSPFRLLSCSYWGEQYILANKQVHGEGFHNILFTHQDGITSCYRVLQETTDFGKFLAQKAIDKPSILLLWSENLKQCADKLREIIKDPPQSFFEISKFDHFKKLFDQYLPYAVANNTAVEYLSEDLINTYGKNLSEARTYTESVYNETETFFRSFTGVIAQQEHRDPLYTSDLFYDEIKTYLTKGILPSERDLEERYSWSGLYFDVDNRCMLNGKQVIEIERSIFEQQSGSIQNEVKGKMASGGRVRGVCRIVPHPARVTVFNEGDILITGMTRPNFVPLMKKAGAIVTDAGGLLSHAAILARELKKPCIIGTEIATKVFKDGDMVEVDAEKGIVKKIN